ncbi:Uncharacterized membrane protein YckC, RDD family [Agrococcus baldri]|uniref:Uncharacterized membrane protein YckC, RDD family n=1 Tax=Agrococcus baldri TaxID=153730 RepID=A0AA94KZM3_9MICO|nr:RDD family protein [Agrococcus baldri]SFS10077.1 Uncharacterized membrane protein YckC, RDD family [Agrococcus baldri]
MNEQPAGWYPDPFAAVPGATRYWDGARWTTQAQEPAPEPQPMLRADAGHGLGAPDAAGPPAVAGGTGWGTAGQHGAAQQVSGHPEGMPFARPDRSGELASWGARLGAYAIDVIPVVVVTMVLLWMTGVSDAMSAALAAQDPAAIDAASAMMAPTHPAGLAITLANLVFVALYNIGFHTSRGQTPGKMLVGIRVRRVDEDRNPDLRGAGLRWLVQFGPNLVSGVALLGMLASMFSIADHLWPMWDQRNQAFHDKAGRTVVVRAR